MLYIYIYITVVVIVFWFSWYLSVFMCFVIFCKWLLVFVKITLLLNLLRQQ